MGGIAIDIDPMIDHLGPLMISWYSLFFALAIVAERVQSPAVRAVMGGLVGARLFHVVDRWEFYAGRPLRVLNVWEGGLAAYGGLIAGVLTGLIYALRHGLQVWRLGDAVAPGMILSQAAGRLACISNGDAYKADGLLFLTYADVYASSRILLTSFRSAQVWFWGL